jgi:hypothetical protein
MTVMRWKVGSTQATLAPGMPEGGYSFLIQDQDGAPLISIRYRTELESKRAESAVREALRNAFDIVKH